MKIKRNIKLPEISPKGRELAREIADASIEVGEGESSRRIRLGNLSREQLRQSAKDIAALETADEREAEISAALDSAYELVRDSQALAREFLSMADMLAKARQGFQAMATEPPRGLN